MTSILTLILIIATGILIGLIISIVIIRIHTDKWTTNPMKLGDVLDDSIRGEYSYLMPRIKKKTAPKKEAVSCAAACVEKIWTNR